MLVSDGSNDKNTFQSNSLDAGMSLLAPVIVNVQNGEWVHQRVLLIYGRAGPKDLSFQSNITVEHHADNFPSTVWPVFNSHFKCLVHLDPGPNNIRFIFDQEPYAPNSPPLSTVITFNYVPLLQNPPLHLAILVAKDSKCVIDAPKEKVDSGENSLEAVKAKFRCTAYLWQAFTAEQMNRNGFGRRVFRLEEEWQPDTLTTQDSSLRQTAKIHIVRTKYTLEELLDPERAQQYHPPPGTPPTDKADLFSIFMEAIEDYGAPLDKNCYIAGLILDTHWDPKMKLIRGHAALGGGTSDTRLGIFGSHTTHAWPRYLEEVVSCFQDDTPIDETILGNDVGESGTWWKCCNIGIGAMLHEVGHALTCPHSPSGIMLRGFNNLNRTFTVQEPNFNSPITPADEDGAHWHRCDTVRFRYHPCFRLPSDSPKPKFKDLHPDFWPLADAVLICCYPGVSLIEVYVNDRFRYHEEYIDDRLHNNDIEIKVLDIKNRSKWKPGEHIKIKVIGRNQAESELDDVQTFTDEQQINLPIYGKVLKSAKLGRGGGQDFQAIFRKPKESHSSESYLTKVIIRFGSYISSITFFWSDNTVLTSGEGGTNEYILDLDKDERILGFNVRSGWWLDALKIKTNKRSSGWIGGRGGGLHHLQVPKGHEMIGIFGSGADKITSFGIFYKKFTNLIKNQTENELDDIQTFPQVNMPSYGRILRGAKLGRGGGQEFQAIFRKPKESHSSESYLIKIIIKSGRWIDSISFFWSDDTILTIGSGGSNEYILTLDEDEKILGFNVKSGWWIDALEIKTNKRNSGLIGGKGGDLHRLQVSKGHELVGIFGSSEDNRITSFGVLYKKS